MQNGWRRVGEVAACAQARAAVVARDQIFAVDADGLLFRVDPASGSAERVLLGDDRARLLASARGLLYVFEENGQLYAMDLVARERERLDGDWLEVTSATGTESELYAATHNLLVIDADGGSRQLGDNLWTPRLLLGCTDTLFCLEENGGLYRIGLEDASAMQLDGDWGDVTAGAAVGDALYLCSEEGGLWVVRPDGLFVPLERGAPPATRFLVATTGALHAIDAAGALHTLALE